jgi:DNA-binding LacI/PurR family transcriptional regulator
MSVSTDATSNTISSTPLPERTRGQKRRQLADNLRKMVGEMRARERFPSVAELEKHYHVSTSTVEAAISDLQAEGLIVRRRGSGTFVAEATVPSPPASPQGTRPRTGHLVITTIGSGGVVNIFTAMAWALEAEMRRAGFDPILLFDNNIQTRLNLAQQRWESGNIDGYVHIGSVDDSVIFPDVPGVVIGEAPEGARVHQVVVDNFGGGRRAGEHLWELGHRKITFLTTEKMLSAPPRFAGLQSVLRERGGGEERVDQVSIASGRESGFVTRAEAALETILNRGDETPTALFFANDQVAFSALQILLSWGIRVPQDLSVISFDDTPGLASQTRPALTSLRMPTLGLGALAVQALNDTVQQPGLPFRRLRLPAELIIRESSGPPRPTDPLSYRSLREGNVPPPTFPLEENYDPLSPL